MAAPGFAAMGTSVADYGLTTIAGPKPSGVSAGHGLLAFLTKENNAAVTAPAGWTQLGSGVFTSVPAGESAPVGLQVFWKRAGGSEGNSYSFSWSGGCYARIVLARFTGVAATGSFIDVYDSEQNSTDTEETPDVSVTTTGADRLLVWAGANWGGGAWTPPSGFTERYDSGETLAVATKVQAAAGSSGNVSGECSDANYSCGFLVALSSEAIDGGGGDPTPASNAGLLPLLMM